MTKRFLTKLYIYLISILFATFSVLTPAQAIDVSCLGPTEPVGPIETVGPVEKVGPSEDLQKTVVESVIGSGDGNDVSADNEIILDSEEDEATTNKIDASLKTGDNNIFSNSQVGLVSTGDINGTISVIQVDHVTAGEVSATELAGGTRNIEILVDDNSLSSTSLGNMDAANGSYLSNINTIGNNNIVAIVQKSDSGKSNQIDIEADTGNNNILSNTTVETFESGNINLGINILDLSKISPQTKVDLNIYSVTSGLTGDIIAPSLAGDGNANNDNSTAVKTTTTNNLNTIDLSTNTGGNNISSNTSVASIESGEVQTAGSALEISTGTPIIYIINVYGHWDGYIDDSINGPYIINQIDGASFSNFRNQSGVLPNDETVDYLQADQKTVDSTNDIKNTGQYDIGETALSDISRYGTNNNEIKVIANTGRNNISNNTTINQIKTGTIKVYTNTLNYIENKTAPLGLLKVNIINIFGNWYGNLTAREKPKQEEAAPSGSEINNDISRRTDFSSDSFEMNNNSLGTNPSNTREDYNQLLLLDNHANSIVETNILESHRVNQLPADIVPAPDEKKKKIPTFLIFPIAIAAGWTVYEIIHRTMQRKYLQ